jgi:hypothetical protein
VEGEAVDHVQRVVARPGAPGVEEEAVVLADEAVLEASDVGDPVVANGTREARHVRIRLDMEENLQYLDTVPGGGGLGLLAAAADVASLGEGEPPGTEAVTEGTRHTDDSSGPGR